MSGAIKGPVDPTGRRIEDGGAVMNMDRGIRQARKAAWFPHVFAAAALVAGLFPQALAGCGQGCGQIHC